MSSIAWLLAILLVLLPTTVSLYHVIPSWSWIIGVVLYVAMAKWLDRWADKRRAALSEQK